MKRIFLFLLSFVLVISTCEEKDDGANPNGFVNLPDTAFLSAVIQEGVDTDGDGLISYVEAEHVTYLDVSVNILEDGKWNYGIYDMTGIEAFINLDSLNCNHNGIAHLNLSKNTKLKSLSCREGRFTSCCMPFRGRGNLEVLEISNNPLLETLDCSFNQISSLDVSNGSLLKYLNCAVNELSSLDVSNNPLLTELECRKNQLTSLFVSNNHSLASLDCSVNNLTKLDISNSPALESLMCEDNQLEELDVSNNVALSGLGCKRNLLTSLDVSKNEALINLECGGNQFTSLNLCNNNSIKYLQIDDIPTLDTVFVWGTFPAGVEVDTNNSPNVVFIYCSK